MDVVWSVAGPAIIRMTARQDPIRRGATPSQVPAPSRQSMRNRRSIRLGGPADTDDQPGSMALGGTHRSMYLFPRSK
jgi:hypothetical protein